MDKCSVRISAQSLTGFMLLVFLGTIVMRHAVMSDQAFSDRENRVLKQRPAFSVQALLSGAFMKDYEQYVTDQFPARDHWIGIKSAFDRALGKTSSNGVFLGADGYLIQASLSVTEVDVEERIGLIRAFHEATPGVRKHVMIAPTAASLLADKLPRYAPAGQEADILNQAQRLLAPDDPDIRYVDAYASLYEKRQEAIYYKTDHHWTTKGAYYAYRALCERMGIVPQDETAFHIEQVTDDFYGSLYSKSGYRHVQPDSIVLYLPKREQRIKVTYTEEERITDSLYEWDNLNNKDQYTVFLNGNHGMVEIAAQQPTGGKLLVVKDSYANSLIPFLTAHFAEIDVVDLRYFEGSLTARVREQAYDEVLLLYNAATFFADAWISTIAD